MRAGDCRHFTGIQHKTCDAGVAYQDVRDTSLSLDGGRFPCHGRGSERCPKFAAVTQEEEDADQRMWDARILDMQRARKAVVETKLRAGNIDCPICRKPSALAFVVNSNGHIHAACVTVGCTSWME